MDYVTKPVEEGRLSAAIGRARSAVRARDDRDRVGELEETVATLRRALRETEGRPQPFWMKSRGEFLRIGSEKVVRIQAERDYVRIFANGQSYLLAESLASLERRLDGAEFIRIHRGVIVRRDAIVRFRRAAYA
ncbi:LytR/AlgR family response regulator transcription factor, partial [Rhizobiaceae sp. 2RAB30]